MAWDIKPKQITLKQYLKKAEDLAKKIQDEVTPFEDTSPAAKAERRKKGQEDLLWFCKTYFPHHFEDDFEQGHYKMADSLKKWNKVIGWLAFRGIGKSTLAEVGYGAYVIVYRLTRFLPIISDTDSQAVDLMLPLRIELQENPRLIADFGEMKGLQWAEDEFITANDVKVEAFSWRSFKRGRKHKQFRFNIAILDDLEDEETAKKESNTKKRLDSLTNNIKAARANRKGQNWQILVCLNRITRTDLSHKLEANKQVLFIKIPAEDENGRAVHPKSFPKSLLNEDKAFDNVAYSKNMLLKIISSEEDDFQDEWIKWIDKPSAPYKYVIQVCDPSVGSTEGHDTKAWIVMGLTADENHIDVIHTWIRNTTISSLSKTAFDLFQKFNPHKVGFESNNFQVLLKSEFKLYALENKKGFGFMQQVEQMQNNAPKNTRILRLQTGIKNGFFRFVKGTDTQRLINQFLNFNSSKTDNEDDGPDAMEMGNRLLRKLNGEIQTVEAEVIY